MFNTKKLKQNMYVCQKHWRVSAKVKNLVILFASCHKSE